MCWDLGRTCLNYPNYWTDERTHHQVCLCTKITKMTSRFLPFWSADRHHWLKDVCVSPDVPCEAVAFKVMISLSCQDAKTDEAAIKLMGLDSDCEVTKFASMQSHHKVSLLALELSIRRFRRYRRNGVFWKLKVQAGGFRVCRVRWETTISARAAAFVWNPSHTALIQWHKPSFHCCVVMCRVCFSKSAAYKGSGDFGKRSIWIIIGNPKHIRLGFDSRGLCLVVSIDSSNDIRPCYCVEVYQLWRWCHFPISAAPLPAGYSYTRFYGYTTILAIFWKRPFIPSALYCMYSTAFALQSPAYVRACVRLQFLSDVE